MNPRQSTNDRRPDNNTTQGVHMDFPRKRQWGLTSPLGRLAVSERTLIQFQKRKPAKEAAKPKSSAGGRKKTEPVKRRRTKKIKIKNGRVHLSVVGHEGLQAVAPSALIRYIPKSHLGVAAGRVLRSLGKTPIKRRKPRVNTAESYAKYKREQDYYEAWLQNPHKEFRGKFPPPGKFPI